MKHSLLIKYDECMTYQFMKVLGDVKYQYSSFVNVVTMPSIDSNYAKSFNIVVLEFIRYKQSV